MSLLDQSSYEYFPYANKDRYKNTTTTSTDSDTITPYIIIPTDNSTTNNLNVAFGGTALPGNTVTLFVDGASVGTFVANTDGRWGGTMPNGILSDGNIYTLTASAVSVDGSTTSGLSNSVTLIVDLASTNYITTETGDILTSEGADQLIWA